MGNFGYRRVFRVPEGISGTGGYFGYRRVFWFLFVFCTRGYLGYQRVFWVPDGILVFFVVLGYQRVLWVLEGILGTRGYFGYHLEGVTGIAQWVARGRLNHKVGGSNPGPPRGGQGGRNQS